MTSRTGTSGHPHRLTEAGLTLIELIAVMALLATLMAIAAPSLSRFFGGRDLKEESRRFLALTRYARSEAVARSAVMELWVEPDTGAYGLRMQYQSETPTKKPLEFALGDGLTFDVGPDLIDEDGVATILFWPDGSIDETSVADLRIVQDDEKTIQIAQEGYGLGYVAESSARDE